MLSATTGDQTAYILLSKPVAVNNGFDAQYTVRGNTGYPWLNHPTSTQAVIASRLSVGFSIWVIFFAFVAFHEYLALAPTCLSRTHHPHLFQLIHQAGCARVANAQPALEH